MTAPFRLQQIDGELQRPQKSVYPAVSSSLALGTSYADIVNYSINGTAQSTGAWFVVGNAPIIDVTLAFTHSTDETLTVLPIFGVAPTADFATDPTIGAPAPYIPADTDGTTPAYVQEVSFTKTNWSTTTSPMSSATVKYVRFRLETNGARLVKLMAKSNATAGSVVAYVSAGTEK